MFFWLSLLLPWLLVASWAENTLTQMTLEEKVGQLFVAPACPLRGEDHGQDWENLLTTCHVGNVIVKQTDPKSQVKMLCTLQSKSKLPLLVAADYEWGLAMTMTEVMEFPRNAVLGQREDLELIFQVGQEIARQARGVGVHLNLAPVVDVNNNPLNPIIKTRSFGSDPKKVADCSAAWIRGFQGMGLLACAKHFPGHGDTGVDSHVGLPTIPHPLERLDQVELPPFQRAIDEGVEVVMTGHLLVPAFDPEWPATLSRVCLQKVLREKMGFQGLIVSDALNMKALTSQYTPEKIAYKAREAGCDLLLYGMHIAPVVDELMRDQIPRAYQALLTAYKAEKLPLNELDEAVLRILKIKEKLGLHKSRKFEEVALFTPEAENLKSLITK